MKKVDIILALITGEVTAWLFVHIIKNVEYIASYKFLFWLLPVLFPILAVIGLWITYLIGKRYLFVFQLGKFFLTGSFITTTDLLVLDLLIIVSGISSGYFYSIFKGISFTIATLVKYVISKYWIFEKFTKKEAGKEFTKFFFITLIGLGINVGAASFIVNSIGPHFNITSKIWALFGGIVGAFSTAIWNFTCYKFIVFKK